jgi:transcriptional regulator with XRE-family HTH domain
MRFHDNNEVRRRKMTLRELRQAAGLRQEDVAKKLNVDQTAVSNWERGKNPPLPKYRKKLCKMYGCTEEELLNA